MRRRFTRNLTAFTRNFLTKIGYAKVNKMPLGSWLFTLFSLVGLVLSLWGFYWLGQVSKQQDNRFSLLSETEPAPLPAIKDIREEVDLVLEMDISGSIDDVDKDSIRFQAIEMIASSLALDIFPRFTQIGYVVFGTDAHQIEKMATIDNEQARLKLIEAIKSTGGDDGDKTNIYQALQLADQMLDEAKINNKKNGKENTPSILLLTDGRPTGANDSPDSIRRIIAKLSDKGVTIFVVVLGKIDDNPSIECTTDDFKPSESGFICWRRVWSDLAREYPLNMEYYDVSQPDDLVPAYNKIISRLVNEGTKPGESVEYDLAKGIVIPPNLLQAKLLVNKPNGVESIQLLDPNGKDFQEYVDGNPNGNTIFDEKQTFYMRFHIVQPIQGKWTFKVLWKEPQNAKPLRFLLNTESIYSIRIDWPIGSPYIFRDQPSLLPIVVADHNGVVIQEPFQISASILRTELGEKRVVEKAYPLDVVADTNSPNRMRYWVKINPEDIGNEDGIKIQLDGFNPSDGSLLNSAVAKLPVVNAPFGTGNTPNLIDATCHVSNENLFLTWLFWQPLTCDNNIELSIPINGAERLDSSTVKGTVYLPQPPFEKPTMGMTQASNSQDTFVQQVGPFTSPGLYNLALDVGGKLKGDQSKLEWHSPVLQKSVQIRLPDWVETTRQRCKYAAVLFAIGFLWKIVIVPLLLVLFSLFPFLKLAPDGFYSKDTQIWSSVFKLAMERRKLFTLTFGYSRANDIFNSNGVQTLVVRNKFLKILYSLCHNRPRAHIYWLPGISLYGEDSDGQMHRGDATSQSIIAGQSQIHIKEN